MNLFNTKNCRIVFTFLILVLGLNNIKVNGQGVVIHLNIIPPYSATLDDYANTPGKVIIQAMNTSPAVGPLSTYIDLVINGPNGITINTPEGKKPGQALVLTPSVNHILSSGEIFYIFSMYNLEFHGITMQDVWNKGLPEGDYTFCVRVRDYSNGNLLSAEGAGCQDITITQNDPPMIIGPVCGDTLPYYVPNQVIFQWNIPTGLQTQLINYTLRITEVLPDGTDPVGAMNSATYPYFFQKMQIHSPVFIYTPGQPVLTKGRTYAFTVTAEDPQHKIYFKNNGTSEVCYFIYGSKNATAEKPPEGKNMDNDTSGWRATTVKGKLSYIYSDLANVSYPLKNTQLVMKVTYSQVTTNQNGSKFYKPNNTIINSYYSPDLNKKVSDIVKNNKDSKKEEKKAGIIWADIAFGNIAGQMVPGISFGYLATTNSKGEFEFHFKLPHGDSSSDQMIKQYSIEFYNPYYVVPEIKFELKPGQEKDLGAIVTTVKSYSLNVNVQQIYKGQKGKILDGMEVMVLRKTKSTDLPDKEGEVSKSYPQYSGYIVVAKAITGKNNASFIYSILQNSVTLNHLVQNLIPGDEYYLYAHKPDANPANSTCCITNYATENNSDLVKFSYKENDKNNSNSGSVYSINIKPTKTLYFIFHDPPKSIVTGSLLYKYPTDDIRPAKPLKNMPVSLVVQYKFTGIYVGQNKSLIFKKNDFDHHEGYVLPPSDNGSVLQTVWTNDKGEYTFNFEHLDSLKVVNQNYNAISSDVSEQYHGKLERVLRVVIQSPYYANPDEDIPVQPWNNYVAPVMTALVQSYNLNVTVKVNDLIKNQIPTINCNADGTISGIKVSVYRKNRMWDIPSDEGQGINGYTNIESEDVYLASESVNGDDGKIYFKNLVRSNGEQDHYIIRAMTSQLSGDKNFSPEHIYYAYHPKKSPPEIPMIYNPTNEIIYNSDYLDIINTNKYAQTKDYDLVIGMYPNEPSIAGRVISTAEPNGVRNALVSLKTHYVKSGKDESIVHITDTMGYFPGFFNLPVEFESDAPPYTNIVGPNRSLYITKNGYQDYNVNMPQLKRGTQFYDGNMKMTPLGTGVYGIVRDSMPNINNSDLKGDPIVARVRLGNGPFVNTYQNYQEQQQFTLDAAYGNNQTLTIIPFDVAYAMKSVKVNINQPKQWLGAFEFNKMVHKIKVHVLKQVSVNNFIPVQWAFVTILNTTLQTDFSGNAYFVFTNNSISNYTVKVSPGSTGSFVPVTQSFTNKESTDFQLQTVVVEKAITVTGKVVSDATKLPLVGARVFVVDGNSNDMNYAVTGQNGKYTLTGVPVYPVTQSIRAVYMDNSSNPQTYIGKTFKIQNVNNLGNQDIDFSLSVYNKLDITQIRGFRVEIDSIREIGGSSVEISGALVKIPPNPNFSLKFPDQRLPFSKMMIFKGNDKNPNGVSYGEPGVDVFGLDIATLPVKIFDIYNGEMRCSQTVLKLEKDYVSGKGKITGLVHIVDNSFNFPSSYLTFTNQDFYLGTFGQMSVNDKNIVAVFKSQGVTYPKTRFSLSKWNTDFIDFKLIGFNGIAFWGKGKESYIYGDSIRLYVKLKADLPFDPVISLNIDAGYVNLYHDHIDPIDLSNEINFDLEKWKVKGVGWKLATNSGGIVIKWGTIKTGIIDVDFSNMMIATDALLCEKYYVNNLTLANVVVLNIDKNIPAENKIFIYDPKVGEDQKGHYKLLILGVGNAPVASFGNQDNMEGVQGYDVFKIQVVSLLSNGQQDFSFVQNHPPVMIHNVAKFTPLTVASYDNYFSILGSVDLGIPGTPKNNQCNINFNLGNPKAIISVKPINIVVNGPGNVIFASGANQVLDANGFTSDGVIKENGVFELKAKLYRPPDANQIKVEVNPYTQLLNFSQKSKLKDVYGTMKVKNNNWDYFSFGGTVDGAKGVGSAKPQKLDFTVFGDIKASNQSIDVKNIDLGSGFSGIEMTYDFANSRLTGSMQLKQTFGAISLDGTANVVFDGDGWYFLGAGGLTTPGLGVCKAGMIIGDYGSFPALVQSTLMQYAYNKNIPCDFMSGIHGFFFTGQKSPPLTIPNINVDMGVMSLKFGGECGVDARVYMNFANGGTVFGMGAMAFAHAWFSLSSVTCTTISAEGRVELLLDGKYDSKAQTISGHGCASVHISGSIEQCFPAVVDCAGCLSLSVDKSVKIELGIDTNGFNGFSFSTGDCSTETKCK